jgi:hypothetical protein
MRIFGPIRELEILHTEQFHSLYHSSNTDGDRCVGDVARIGMLSRLSTGKPTRNISLARLWHRWEDNIRI